MMTYRKKLIEVDIPLRAINVESAKDASLTHGHPSTLHRYWARRPLAACRAIIFVSLVDDPAECPDEFPTESQQNAERNRLHSILREVIKWQHSTDAHILAEARREIAISIARNNGEDPYKQQKQEQEGKASTAGETMLTAIVNAGFQIVSTWPMRTERPTGLKSTKNALASSIVLVCRPRPEDAPAITRNDFIRELQREMPTALDRLTRIANIRPVDVAQAAIGPGMQVYSRYTQVTRMSGHHVPIREALMHINEAITAYYEEETGTLDAETQFCLIWLRQHGYMTGSFGDADGLAKARNVALSGMHDKVLLAARGEVRLLRQEEYMERKFSEEISAWEGCHRMMWHLSGEEHSGGVKACAEVADAMRSAEGARTLAHVLYAYYDARGDVGNAADYNNLVTEWRYIMEATRSPRQLRVT